MKLSALLISIILLTGIFNTSENPKDSAEMLKPFEGTVTYSIEYLEVPSEVEGMESMLPQETIMSISGDLVMVEQEVMGGSQIVIVDNQKKESHILMNMMGQKIDIFLSREEMEASEKETANMEIEELEGVKTILGYKCKEARITNPDTGDTQIVYYTKKLDIEHKDFNGLKGFPLEYSTSQQNMKIKMTVTKISSKKLPASIFEIPEGYTRMTMDELNKMTGN